MDNLLEYKGYQAKIEIDHEDKIFVGSVLGVKDSLNFHGSTIDELQKQFENCIDDYLEMCKSFKKAPETAKNKAPVKRKRLTIRNSDGSVSQPLDLDWSAALHKLASFEDKEEKGQLEYFPCTVGDVVYKLWSSGKPKKSLASFVVAEIFNEGPGWKFRIVSSRGNSRIYDINDFGKKIFADKSEAEFYLYQANN